MKRLVARLLVMLTLLGICAAACRLTALTNQTAARRVVTPPRTANVATEGSPVAANDDHVTAPASPTAVDMPLVSDRRASRIEGRHKCWLVGDGFKCGGSNSHGELGRGLQLPPLVDVQAGDSRTCALDIAGRVWCWGWDLGEFHGTYVDDALEPVQIPLPGPATLISVGLGQECAAVVVSTGSEIWCWGTGYNAATGYQLGQFAPASTPVRMWSGRHVHEMRVGYQDVHAHVGTTTGCGWVTWGVTPDGTVNRPQLQ